MQPMHCVVNKSFVYFIERIRMNCDAAGLTCQVLQVNGSWIPAAMASWVSHVYLKKSLKLNNY